VYTVIFKSSVIVKESQIHTYNLFGCLLLLN